jgi:psiF repeat
VRVIGTGIAERYPYPPMRVAITATFLLFCLVLLAVQPAPSQAPATSAPATTPTSAQTAATEGAVAGSEAAEKHAKRTDCLKQAKTKKLLGSERTEFLKTCYAAP